MHVLHAHPSRKRHEAIDPYLAGQHHRVLYLQTDFSGMRPDRGDNVNKVRAGKTTLGSGLGDVASIRLHDPLHQ